MHGGGSPQARRKAQERFALEAAVNAHPRRAPADVLADVGHRADYLMSRAWSEVRSGELTAETMQQLIERLDTAGRWAKTNLDAGTVERQTRVLEAYAAGLIAVVERIVHRLELTDEQRQRVITVIVPEELQRQHELEAGNGHG